MCRSDLHVLALFHVLSHDGTVSAAASPSTCTDGADRALPVPGKSPRSALPAPSPCLTRFIAYALHRPGVACIQLPALSSVPSMSLIRGVACGRCCYTWMDIIVSGIPMMFHPCGMSTACSPLINKAGLIRSLPAAVLITLLLPNQASRTHPLIPVFV